MRTLFLNPPSYAGFDGGAGARYQAKREIRSYWYPTWLAQPAALVPDSLLIDAPPAGKSLADIVSLAAGRDLAILYTSSPTFAGDVKVAEALKEANPGLRIGLAGPPVAVPPRESLEASPAIDFVAREEFDFTIAEVAEGRPLSSVDGLSYRNDTGDVVHNADRAILEDMDKLPPVLPIYKRDLQIEDYYIGYLHHPYVSLYTGRGCRSRCTFCLWPQTVGGHRYRTKSVGAVLDEAAMAKELVPQMKELFFDDDTFPGDQQILINIKKGLRVERAKQFAADCRDLGITVHGTFILGLPGETKETIQETIAFAREVNPHTIQVSVAAPYPGTELYRQAKESGWLPPDDEGTTLVSQSGTQLAALNYPHLGHTEILDSVDDFYRRFYFRAPKIAEMSAEMLRHPSMAVRRLREGTEFIQFLGTRARGA